MTGYSLERVSLHFQWAHSGSSGGLSWAILGLTLGNLGAHLGHLGDFLSLLGHPVFHYDRILARTSFVAIQMGPYGVLWGASGAILGFTLGHLGAHWVYLGVFLGALGHPKFHYDRILARTSVVAFQMGPFGVLWGALLGHLGVHFGLSWGSLGPSWGLPGPPWAPCLPL